MAKPVFEVELLHTSDTDKQLCVELTLPATPWELADAVDTLRLADNDGMTVDILNCHGYDFVDEHLGGHENIYALNALAQKLAEWDDVQREAYRGMVAIERLGEDHSLPALINIAYSADSYNVAEAVNDEQLGRFYVDGGFVPETDDLTDEQCELLDYAKIGKRMRTGEKGIFTAIGYVVKTGELQETFSSLDLKPRRPDYTVLLKLTESGRMLKLPMSRDELAHTLEKLEKESWQDVPYLCVDCRVPALREAISATSVISVANRAAQTLHGLSDSELRQYKAVLEARGFDSLADALEVADALDEYVFSPEFASYEDIGRGELRFAMDKTAADILMPYVNLRGYGKAVAEHDHVYLTGYGGIERRDGQPIQRAGIEETPAMGGMEMM